MKLHRGSQSTTWELTRADLKNEARMRHVLRIFRHVRDSTREDCL